MNIHNNNKRAKKVTIERLSIFDIFKIGVGPSSSHTFGPWRAARDYLVQLDGKELKSLKVHLFGSLSKTGKGHATDVAVMMGLEDYDPKTVDIAKISDYIDRIKKDKTIKTPNFTLDFNPEEDIVFEDYSLEYHPNALTFKGVSNTGESIEETYFSIGGGFIAQKGKERNPKDDVVLPYPIDHGRDLIKYTDETGMSISEVVLENELVFDGSEEVKRKILEIWKCMENSIFLGSHKEGILPGGLNVRRRAKNLNLQLLNGNDYADIDKWREAIRNTGAEYGNVNKWLSCFALAVNEENASLGRIVTSPTNGAAGVIPSVLMYYTCFKDFQGEKDIIKFLLTAGEIGCIFKKNATISAAMGGCQAEIGVSSAMAAGAMTELMGGTPRQVLMAAEISMEHHLGLTCDPVNGLVQIPCIERNTMGANKALTAANLALSSDPNHAIVDFDTVVQTMWETAQDMMEKYKETSEGGLAINVPLASPNC